MSNSKLEYNLEPYILELENINTIKDEKNLLTEKIQKLENEISALREKTERDELTKSLKRQAFLDLIDKRKKFGFLPRRLCLVVADMNNLKEINDKFGHLAGDEAIKHFASILAQAAPDGSLIARFGGDEFVMAIPVELEFAPSVLRSFKKSFEECPLKIASALLNVTASLGITQWDVDVESFGEAFERADQVMYKEKKAHKLKCSGDSFNKPLPWAQKMITGWIKLAS